MVMHGSYTQKKSASKALSKCKSQRDKSHQSNVDSQPQQICLNLASNSANTVLTEYEELLYNS